MIAESLIVTIVFWYLTVGLAASVLWLFSALTNDIMGNIDPKLGPAWKSFITYVVMFMMACPILNVYWIFCLIKAKYYVRKK